MKWLVSLGSDWLNGGQFLRGASLYAFRVKAYLTLAPLLQRHPWLGSLPPWLFKFSAYLLRRLVPVLARYIEPVGLSSARESHSEFAGRLLGCKVGNLEWLGARVI